MLRFSPLFGSGAILCRRKPIRISGVSDQKEVLVCLADAQGKELASDLCPAADGRFEAVLPPQEAAAGCTLYARAGAEEAVSTDILIGEIYLAAGQSNMELELRNADEGEQLIPRHENDRVRYLNVPRIACPGPENDEAFLRARWQPVAPGKAEDISAVAYFFAMKLQQETNVPVGIVGCNWGGTSITCWMDRETLFSSREGKRYWDEYEKLSAGKTMEEYKAEEAIAFQKMRDWEEKAAPYREKEPFITSRELEKRIGPYPWKIPEGPGSPYRPAGLYEAMLSHLIPLSLTGVLFYQGEEDTWRTKEYDTLLIDFIRMLRTRFADDALPFLNVQLPMWIDEGAQDSFLWPRLRLQQDAVRKLIRNSSLACLIDQGEYGNIHPTAKRVVGERLCMDALRLIHGKDRPVYPEALYAVPDGDKVVIRLSEPVIVRGEGSLLLEASCDGSDYSPVQADVLGRTLILSCPERRAVSVRYAWTDYGTVRLFGENGLPLRPFLLRI